MRLLLLLETQFTLSSFDGNFYALKATDGSQVWNYTHIGVGSSPAIDGGVISSPSIDGGVIYLGSDRTVYALGESSSSFSSIWSNNLFIIVGVVVAVVIVAAVVFLMFRKRSKTKPTSPTQR